MPDDIHTPEWVKDAVFYQIFPDRFAISKQVVKPNNLETWESEPTPLGFKGGDLLGVAEHLDYLQDLGITAIYLNPIFQSTANHRYHTHDYYKVDPMLGGNLAFNTLLENAHQRRIRVILDGVFNHVGRGFFQFNDILENGSKSPYIDWFHVHSFPLNAYWGRANYDCWASDPALPKLNTNNPQVRQLIFDVACYWLEQGIDGWRLDVPFEIDDDLFWQEFRQVVKSVNPDAYIVGEVATEAQRWLQGDQFDAVMNYQFSQACLGFFGGENIDWGLATGVMGLPSTPILDVIDFGHRVDELLRLYPWEISLSQLNLLDSHDTPRFLSLVKGDRSALRMAYLFQMTYPGAPCIYYGDEIGMEGGRDPNCRKAFLWDELGWDGSLQTYLKNIIALRRSHPVLRRGEYINLYAQGPVFAYLRRLGEEDLVVIFNTGLKEYEIDIPAGKHLPQGSHWQSLIERGTARVDWDKLNGMALPPRSGAVLRKV